MANGQIVKRFITDNAVGATKIQVENNQSLRFRNAADSADISVLKMSAADLFTIETDLVPDIALNWALGGDANQPFFVVNTQNVHDSYSVSFSGDIQGDGVTVTNIADTSELVAGASVSGVNITDGTSIASVDSPTQITLDTPGTPAVATSMYAYSFLGNHTADTAGSATDMRNSGNWIARSGFATGAGNTGRSGDALVSSGNATDGGSGQVRLRSGSISGAIGVSGQVFMNSGNSGAGGSGQVLSQSGNAPGGTSGNVKMQSGTGATRGDAILNAKDVLLQPDGHTDNNSKLIKSVADPVDPQDAATKAYVDAAIGGTTPFKDTFVLTAPDIAAGFVTLSVLADHKSVTAILWGASPLVQSTGTPYDYNLTDPATTQLNFEAAFLALLVPGDVLQVTGTN